ncbi:MAG: YncE family protein [Planctomycetota bacterium]
MVAAALPSAFAGGKYGFANVPGGHQDDPVIKVYGSIGPNNGAQMSMKERQANNQYMFSTASGAWEVTNPPPVIPPDATGANQFVMLLFPMAINKGSIRKTLMRNKASLAPTSYLTSNISITDETGAHVPGIAVINGKTAFGVKVKNDPFFPTWQDAAGKNRLLDKKAFVYVSDLGDQDITSVAAFGGTGGTPEVSVIGELRIRLHSVGGAIVNGFWVLKIGDGTGVPVLVGSPVMNPSVARRPVTPPRTSNNGDPVVESFSKYVVEFTEPVVPESVGFSAAEVKEFNAGNPLIPLLYNGNTAVIPNPENLGVPIYPNFLVEASPNGVSFPFLVPYDVRPLNPNNLAQYLIDPIMDLPDTVDLTLRGLDYSGNVNTIANGSPLSSAATTFWNGRFDDAAGPYTAMAFRISGGHKFTNVPVAPQALYFATLSGTGMGVVNLDGQGFETNDPATTKLVIVTNYNSIASCPFGSILFGCNKNGFGDLTGNNPIGLGGNPPELGGPTPVPGINEGSVGTLANGANPRSIYPPGFETVVRNSAGDPRLVKAPEIGSVGDIQVGDFLDKVYYDTLNPKANFGLHTSIFGGVMPSNTIADPPVPNPPPLRLPVGLPPVDIVFDQQHLKRPAFVIEGDEVFSVDVRPFGGTPDLPTRFLLIPNLTIPAAGDTLPTFAQNGPQYQSFNVTYTYASRQQIGNFLYVTDRDNGVIQCLNSNTMAVIASIQTPDPEGLGMAPDLRTLYVSNLGDDSVSIIGTDPYSPYFHTEINRVRVGTGPRDVAVQPEGEDVFVCNYFGNTISILDPTSQTIRKTLSTGLSRPWEIVLTPRFNLNGFQSANYQGYVINQGTGDIIIYESGPSGAAGVGADVLRWSATLDSPLAQLRHVCYDPQTYPGSPANLPGGIYTTHRDRDTGLAMISRICWTSQQPAFGAFPPVPLPWTMLNAPSSIDRTFEVVGSWGGPLVPITQQINFGGQDQIPYDAALIDIRATDFFAQNPVGNQTNLGPTFGPTGGSTFVYNSKNPLRFIPGGVTNTMSPDRLYVSFPGDNRIEVLDPDAAGIKLSSIPYVPVPGRLATYFDQ